MKLAFVIYKLNLMKNLKLFIELTRLDKPIGYMLLFWPCVWGLTLVYNFNSEINTYFKYLIFFLLGSIYFAQFRFYIHSYILKMDRRMVE